MMEEDMIGAIKIKDALFIGDEFAAQVSYSSLRLVIFAVVFLLCLSSICISAINKPWRINLKSFEDYDLVFKANFSL